MKTRSFVFFFFLFSPVFGQYNFSPLDQVLTSKQKVLGGKICMLIYKDGNIIYEKNIGGYSRHTQEPVASCSKWISAAMMMTFVQEGKISLEDTIGKFIPLFTKKGKGRIKVWQCLSHTTGIEGGDITLASLMSRNKYNSLEEEVNDFALKRMAAAPGKQFCYSDIGLNIAGRIMEVISGKDFETIFLERIGKPLEMTSTSFKTKQAINPSGGLVSTPSDYMNFLVMILNKGTFKGKQILKEEYIEKMQENATEEILISYVPEQAISSDYGYGEWILEKDDDDMSTVLSSPGVFGTFPYIDLTRRYAAILFVKTLNIKSRKDTYGAIKGAVDKVIPVKH
jgi:CubicO group peptidase (beta-lactamase class C family)